MRHGGPDCGDGHLRLGIILGCKCVGVLELCVGAIHFGDGAVLLYLVRGWEGRPTNNLKTKAR